MNSGINAVHPLFVAILAPVTPAKGDDEPARFVNHYRHCGETWSDTWSCACNDHCPVCDAEIEPYESEEIAT